MIRVVSKNDTHPCYALKCDVKFFDSVDHITLLSILRIKIKDINLMRLIEEIVRSYTSDVKPFY